MQNNGMDKIRISAVKYANTYPFMYGLTESGFERKVVLETDHPSDCAAKLINGRADLGLIPVAALPLLKEFFIIGDYCIGANGNVRTVLLLSNCKFDDIETIYLDYRSRSSVNLSKVLAGFAWNREFRWMNTSRGFDFRNIGLKEAVVLIGDQCFEYEKSFRYKIDLAAEWKSFTGLPFVFACWASNRQLEAEFVEEFNHALKLGVENIEKVVKKYGESGSITGDILHRYLVENIDYIFDDQKRKGMELFLSYLKKL
jgi:chorismate dehydratase